MDKRIKEAQSWNSSSDDTWCTSFVWFIFLTSLIVYDWVKENKGKSVTSLIVGVAAIIIGVMISWKSATEILLAYILFWAVRAAYNRWQKSSSPFSGW